MRFTMLLEATGGYVLTARADCDDTMRTRALWVLLPSFLLREDVDIGIADLRRIEAGDSQFLRQAEHPTKLFGMDRKEVGT